MPGTFSFERKFGNFLYIICCLLLDLEKTYCFSILVKKFIIKQYKEDSPIKHIVSEQNNGTM